MASPIENLPAEILDQILKCVSTGDYKPPSPEEVASTYSALSRCSRKLYSIVTPYLYNTFQNFEGDQNILGCTRTVCERPDIAAAVERIEAKASLDQCDIDEKDLKILESALQARTTTKSAVDKIAAALADGCCTAQLLVLLSACTQVREIDFTTFRGYQYNCPHCFEIYPWLHDFFSDSQVRTAYDQLKRISIRGSSRPWKSSASSYEYCLPLLHLPGLDSFTGDGLMFGNATSPSSITKPSQTLSDIRMSHAVLKSQEFEDIILSTNVLATLCVEFELCTGMRVNDLPPSRLHASLLQHHETLETLALTNIVDHGFRFEFQPAFNSLAEFLHLKRLTLDEYLLRGQVAWQDINIAGILPASLQSLTIHTYNSLDALVSICDVFTSFRSQHLAEVQITFACKQESVHQAFRTIPEKDWAPNEYDLGRFSKLWSDTRLWSPTRNHIALTYCNKPELLANGFAGLKSLLTGSEGDVILDYMLSKQAPFSLKEDGSVVVFGVGLEVFVRFDSDWLWQADLGLQWLFEEE